MTTNHHAVAPVYDTTPSKEIDLTVPERLWEWTRTRASLGHGVLVRERGLVIDNEQLPRDDVSAALNDAVRIGCKSVTIPSRARLADVIFRVVGVREPATVIWDATVESLELDAALKALGMTLTIHASTPYRGPGERSYAKGHIVVPYTLTCPTWMGSYGGGHVTAASGEEGRRSILRRVRSCIATTLSERARSIDDFTKRIETARGEALAIVGALSLIDSAPERA